MEVKEAKLMDNGWSSFVIYSPRNPPPQKKNVNYITNCHRKLYILPVWNVQKQKKKWKKSVNSCRE